MAKQLSLFGPEEPSDAPAPSPTLAPTSLEPGQPVQGALFDDSFTGSLVLPDVPLEEGCRIVETEAELRALAAVLTDAGRFAYDTETSSLDVTSAALVGISLSHRSDEAVYVPVTHPSGRGLPAETIAAILGPLFADPAVGKVGHNLKYDIRALARAGMPVRGLAFDTLIASHLLEVEEDHGLKALALRVLGREMKDFNTLTRRGKRRLELCELPVSAVANYACADAQATWQLYEHYAPRIPTEGLQPVFDLEMALIPIVAAMESAGIRIDVPYLKQLEETMQVQVRALTEEIYAIAGKQFNLNSTPQLANLLYNELGLPALKQTRTRPSTDESVLRTLADRHPLPAKILEYRELTKLISTYVVALAASVNPETGRVHPSFRQMGAVSGRFSCTEPNLQNLPKDTANTIRRAFVAAPGTRLLSADYSQVELRILAHYSEEPALLQSFAEGEDVHRRTASEIFDMPREAVTPEHRRVAKTVNFGLIYGMSATGLSARLGISVEQAQDYIDRYFARYPNVKRFLRETIERGIRSGYVETLLGRRLPARGLQSKEPRARAATERQVINFPIQGTAADIMKMAMVRLGPRLEAFQARLLLQVHDELVLEVPEAELEAVTRVVVEAMEAPPVPEFRVPLVVETKVDGAWS
jgi:DNA polymerase I